MKNKIKQSPCDAPAPAQTFDGLHVRQDAYYGLNGMAAAEANLIFDQMS